MVIYNCPICKNSASMTFFKKGYHIGCDNEKCILHKNMDKTFPTSGKAVSIWNNAVTNMELCEFCECFNKEEGNCEAFICTGTDCPKLPCEEIS